MDMENLILMLQVLVLGMRGVRRAALESVAGELKVLCVQWRDSRDAAAFREEALQKRLTDADHQIDDLGGTMLNRTWTLRLRRGAIWSCSTGDEDVVCGNKVHIIKALRMVTDLGLREAYDTVENQMNNPDRLGWFTLTISAKAAKLGCALSVLLEKCGLEISDIQVRENQPPPV
jgi:hypothetical protein